MRSSHWPILSNEKLPLAHLVKTKRTMTDELAIGHISSSLPVHEHGGVLGLDGVHHLLAEEVVDLGVPVNLLVVAESVTKYL